MTDTLRHTVPGSAAPNAGIRRCAGTRHRGFRHATDSGPVRGFRTASPCWYARDAPGGLARSTDAPGTVPTDNTGNTTSGDTLAADSAADGEFPFLPFGDPFPELQATPWHDVPAAEVFGTASRAAPPQPIYSARAESLTENPVFQGFVLLLAATYAMLLYRNLEDVRLLLTRVSRDRATGERLTEDPGGSGFSRFLNIATTIGMLFMGVMVVKYGDSLMPGRLTELLSHGA